MEPKIYDLIVIGAGSGGLACAKRAAGYGKKVAIIEKSRIGGTCVNVGCMPKKVMYNAANLRELIHLAQSYGFKTTESFDWRVLKEKRDAFVKRLNANHTRVLANSGAEYYEGFGHFVSPHRVQVGDGVVLEAESILIATGGKPLMPSFPGNQFCGTSDTFWELEELPKRSLVIGGGYIAVEMAGILNALGSETSLACRYDRPLRRYDPFVTDLLMEEMARTGLKLLPNCVIDRVEKRPDGTLDCFFQNGVCEKSVDFVLMAAGRVPNLEHLGLEIPRVAVHDGHVVVNEREETSSAGIYCLGDDIGKVDLTPVAIQAGRRLADRLFGGRVSLMDYEKIPSVVFAHPPIGTCGWTEARAREEFGDDVQVYKTVFSNTLYALSDAEAKRKTGMKLVCQKSTQKVLGVHLIGDNVDEMLQGFAVAIKMGATKMDLDNTVAIHPTSAEEVVTFAPWGQYCCVCYHTHCCLS